jgi:hypothetical protein
MLCCDTMHLLNRMRILVIGFCLLGLAGLPTFAHDVATSSASSRADEDPIRALAGWTQAKLPSIGCDPASSKVVVLNFRMTEGVNEGVGVQLADELSSAAGGTNGIEIPMLDRNLLKTYLRVGPKDLSMFRTDQEISRLANGRGACAVVTAKAEKIEGNTY